MPITPTYPGVYVEEIASGVRTITGVSTSVTAFVGSARRGSINKAVRLLSYSDFERRFGGLSAESEMSYAVRQFFANGGSEAWVVRLVKDPFPAFLRLQNADSTDVLELKARDEGFSGNSIEVRIDYKSTNPTGVLASNFNLTLNYAPEGMPEENRTEVFQNLSMNSKDARYVKTIMEASQLVKVERKVSQDILDALENGKSLSGELTADGKLKDVAKLRDANHDKFRISINGSSPVTITITEADLVGADETALLASLCTAIASKMAAAAPTNPKVVGFKCEPNPNNANQILMTSGIKGEESSVRVLPGESNDLAARLLLGTAHGGTEIDAVAELRPVETPARGSLTSGQLVDADVPASGDPDAIPATTHINFRISLDGDRPWQPVQLDSHAAVGGTRKERLTDLANRIESAVRKLKPLKSAYRDFTVAVANDTLILTSGSRGKGSSVEVSKAESKDIAANLKLLLPAAKPVPVLQNTLLEGGHESP